MRFKHYLSDQKWLLLTFYLILFIISVLISVDPHLKVAVSSLVYLVLMAAIIFNLYFIGAYFSKKNLLAKWQNQALDSLPRPASYEQEIYSRTFKQLEEKYLNQIYEQNEAAKEQLEFMTQWFHEIKTPIAVSRLLLETEVDSPSLQEEIIKIESYVEQALYFSRLHEFNKDYIIQEIDLPKLIKEIIISETKTFISKKIKIDLKLNPMLILSDRKGLMFVIRQVLLNSLKYTNENGEISIKVDPKMKELVLTDTGIGIPPEDLPRVFEKGFTGKNGRTQQRSTGMGLYLAKKTAEKLGHNLSLTSSTVNGTVAVFHFPDRSDTYYHP